MAELTRAEVDMMLPRADEIRTKLRRATRELQRFGEDAMAARETERTAGSRDATSPADPATDRRDS